MLKIVKYTTSVAATALLLPLSFISSASAVEQVSGTTAPFTFSNPGDGLVGVLPGPDGNRYAAGTYVLNSNNTNVLAYDVSFPLLTEYQASFSPTPWGSSGVSDIAKAADIAARHTDIGSAYNDSRWESAAAQVAIWSLTSGVDPAATGNAKFTERVEALRSGASAANEPNFGVTFDATATATEYGTLNVEVTAFDSNGPIPAQPFELVVGDGDFAGVSANSGSASIDVARTFAGQTATISTTVKVPAGVFLQSSTGASILTASASPVTSSFEIALPTLAESDAAVAAAGNSTDEDGDLAAKPSSEANANSASESASNEDSTEDSKKKKKDKVDSSDGNGYTANSSSGDSNDSASGNSSYSSEAGDYQEAPSALPKTGIADSTPILALLLAVAVLSGAVILVTRKS